MTESAFTRQVFGSISVCPRYLCGVLNLNKSHLATRFQSLLQEKKLERLRKRRTRPTLNHVYDQHSINIPLCDIQQAQLGQRRNLRQDRARQAFRPGIVVESPVKKLENVC